MTRIAMTYGRFNPPTIGHQRLVDKLTSIVAHDRFIYLSPTTGKNNPLDFGYKHQLVTKAFGGIDVIVSEIQHKDVFAAVKWANDLGYSSLHLVVGGDRFEELNKRIPMYNGDLYKFNHVQVYNAGERDKNSDGIDGMSASHMRDLAMLGRYEEFEKGLPNKLRSMSRDIYERVREACLLEVSATF